MLGAELEQQGHVGGVVVDGHQVMLVQQVTPLAGLQIQITVYLNGRAFPAKQG